MSTKVNMARRGPQKSLRKKANIRQRMVVGHFIANGGSMSEAIRAAGYSEAMARNPQKLMQSPAFKELLETKLADTRLAEVHEGLLFSTKIENMVFPLGPKDEDDPNLSGAQPNAPSAIEKGGIPVERTTLTDEEIKEMLAEVNCKVRKIVHGDTARHVYYWAADTKARADALKLAYDLKGRLGKGNAETPPANNTYNTFIQNNGYDPNQPTPKTVVANTLDALMKQTNRQVLDVKPEEVS